MLGSTLCLFAALLAGLQLQERWAYRALAEDLTEPTVDADDGGWGENQPVSPQVNWSELARINGDIAAWVEVRRTDISLPVVQSNDAETDFYLHHDLWKRESVSGTPFLDHRTSADSPHRLVFGHHLPFGGQFSQLQTAYTQERFDRLGACIWQVPGADAVTLLPLCAMTVDQWFSGIQHFSFENSRELQAWLVGICKSASARASEWNMLVRGARSVVTLVTCSSGLANQPYRTLVIFVEEVDAAMPSSGNHAYPD